MGYSANSDKSEEEVELQEQMVALIRAFGLHEPDRTPCGEPMSVSEAHALMEMEVGHSLSQNQLAARLHLEKSTVSRLVMQLQARGWIRQETAPNDGRMRLISLTEAGERAAESLAEARRHKYKQLFEAIPEAEREAVFHALKVVIRALQTGDVPEPAIQNEERKVANATA